MMEESTLDKLIRMNLLVDFYGQLLTERQRQVLSYYYEDNLSLGEIANELKVSRQAVFDLLKRVEKLLEGYEGKLGLVNRWQTERAKLLQTVGEMKEALAKRDWNNIENAVQSFAKMVEEGRV
ncbi:YlxM family DNA-binding protein [Heliorestis acidaminivorans]|uniref:UPF0122 protein F9B85_01745 n=1 Tax=Heliorestis acidaminivorans TaxID=553427 RepID=A0A6I0F4G7_9FIRM|nr:YlxM family DNA-binding protein [Heliorestis acidaminivorans]KAB2954433.1 YlxM family DNA-binding protein [Heliorestis acidaminivorans]